MKANSNGAPSMEKESEDEILSKRHFETDSGVNLDKFLITSVVEEEAPKEADETQEKEIDVAVGEVAEIFSRGDAPSRINRDGTVDDAPEVDSVTEYAMEG